MEQPSTCALGTVRAMPTLRQIAAHLDGQLHVGRYPDERNGALTTADVPVERLGLALDPRDVLPVLATERLDAVLLHRSWGYERLPLPPSLGVLAYHMPFDDHLTLGYNTRLAAVLGMTSLEPLGQRGERVLGMLGDVAARPMTALQDALVQHFGALEAMVPPRQPIVRRIGVVGAMTAELVEEASRRGADLYLTGQLRVPARRVVAETGIGVVAVGHARSEQWGLRSLRDLLVEAWPALDVVVCAPAVDAIPECG